jgi:hypothetical protein
MAAGVRSTSFLPYGASFSALATCALAEVASKTIPISSKPSIAISPSTPSDVVGTFIRWARARPSESGSMPTIAPISSTSECRMTLIIRSVPMLPDPMIATLVLVTAPPHARTSRTRRPTH